MDAWNNYRALEERCTEKKDGLNMFNMTNNERSIELRDNIKSLKRNLKLRNSSDADKLQWTVKLANAQFSL